MDTMRSICVAGLALLCLFPARAAAQEAQPSAGRWGIAALPSVGYDADEGFGYGALAEIYHYRAGASPYVWTLQPMIEFSTRGRRDVTLFFDAPHLLPGGWRLESHLGSERQRATPYFGLGNDTPYDSVLDRREGPTPYYYRFEQQRERATLTLQRRLGELPLRVLIGAGVSRVAIDPTPYDEGTTLLEEELLAAGRDAPGGWSNHLRAGLIRDTRDREIGPTRGAWSEVLVQRVDGALGSDYDYTRWTFTDRRYFPLVSRRLVFANRFVLQGVEGDAPFYDLAIVQTSFKPQEGLGGAKTIRGLPKNRHVGKGLFLWNAELRWRAVEFQVLSTDLHLVVNGFVDQGRVWEERIVLGEILSDLHRGLGGGVRLGMGESFVVSVDVGHSAESAAPIYVGLGYLF